MKSDQPYRIREEGRDYYLFANGVYVEKGNVDLNPRVKERDFSSYNPFYVDNADNDY